MGLAGQGNAPHAPGPNGDRERDAGYIMVVLLVAMGVAAIGLSAALPSWRHHVIREREAELVFRGEAIARAIYLYRQKNGQALPPSLDVLVSQRYLRKKYNDPITGKDFLVVGGATAPGGRAGGPTAMQTGIVGVRSTSNETSIRIYNNQQTYSQWAFDFTLEQLRAGGGAVNAPTPGGGPAGRGGRGSGGPTAAPGEMNPIQPGRRGGQGGPALESGRGGTPSPPQPSRGRGM